LKQNQTKKADFSKQGFKTKTYSILSFKISDRSAAQNISLLVNPNGNFVYKSYESIKGFNKVSRSSILEVDRTTINNVAENTEIRIIKQLKKFLAYKSR